MVKSSTRGQNLISLTSNNRSLIVRLLLQNGSCSRTELAKETTLTQAAITKIIDRLIKFGLVEEHGFRQGKRGRSAIMLRINTDRFLMISVKFSCSSYDIGLYNLGGNREFPIAHYTYDPDLSPAQTIDRIEESINAISARHQGIIAAGIAAPSGFIARLIACGRVLPEPAHDSIYHSVVQSKCSFPVLIGHDSKIGAAAEWWYQNNVSQNLVFLTLDAGVGASVICDGNILRGSAGYAGEIGHISIDYQGRTCPCSPGARGCIEQYCSVSAFLRDVREELTQHSSCLSVLNEITLPAVFQAADTGDVFAVSMIKKLGFFCGLAIVSILHAYNPDQIIISGALSAAGDTLMKAIHETLLERMHPSHLQALDISFSQLKDDPVLLGASTMALEWFLENLTNDYLRENNAQLPIQRK